MKILTILLVLFFSCFRLHAQQTDSIAVQVVRSNLSVVAGFIDKKDTSLKKISEAILFLNELTGIYNEFYGKYYGQFKPTSADLKAWTAWLEMNKAYLKWDRELKSMILYKIVKAEIQ